ncbi:hypothetical protein BJV78DRAFT_1349960 [Lactifluus subvellereus]|nr:hypothetical protein BJV78DRAFT_1349960 [Lactifluus subvellereus]
MLASPLQDLTTSYYIGQMTQTSLSSSCFPRARSVTSTRRPRRTTLLFVASDRISAYDVTLKNEIPDKGRVLTELSLFWFDKLKHIIPNHVMTSRIEEMPEEVHQHREQLEGRSILVREAEVVPLEAIVRGYITAGYAATRGLIIADTKFEFGLVDGELILIDEALTPLALLAAGGPSFDKQYLRDPDGQGWTMSDGVVQGKRERYLSARNKLLK